MFTSKSTKSTKSTEVKCKAEDTEIKCKVEEAAVSTRALTDKLLEDGQMPVGDIWGRNIASIAHSKFITALPQEQRLQARRIAIERGVHDALWNMWHGVYGEDVFARSSDEVKANVIRGFRHEGARIASANLHLGYLDLMRAAGAEMTIVWNRFAPDIVPVHNASGPATVNALATDASPMNLDA